MNVHPLGGGVFTITDFLSDDECSRYIALSEAMGYEEASMGPAGREVIFKEHRNNDRIVFDRADIAQELFEKARASLPAELDGWRLSGFNERMRFYRYDQQQYFKWHRDGTFRRSDQEESFLTFMMYLNDGFEGGDTQFQWDSVKPQRGMALVFPHRLSHQGSPVISGVKYVLRTDVMYSSPAPVQPAGG
ncbi:2OG-Fe(II) oxygenase [Piscinibacter terrae]|uniref:Iron-regulated protein n=1 Tax=Piscinibacter terrae TaxID=2496871 RepID=A0A3N7J715_9BURK|nr:2OG-Fe(II) oxygenase [Albitalea terrae]RQP26582.1 iron-regulated protein [Albitalea terrae]